MRIRHIVICALPDRTIFFSHCLIKGNILWKSYWIKIVFFMQLLSETFFILRTERDMTKMCIGLHIKYTLFLSKFNVFMRVFESSSFNSRPPGTLTALKMQFVRRLQMVRRTLYIASWQVYLGEGSNGLIVMEDISKTFYWRSEAFCESKTLTYLTVLSCIYCCVQ
jgi:hypothetical protein